MRAPSGGAADSRRPTTATALENAPSSASDDSSEPLADKAARIATPMSIDAHYAATTADGLE